MSEHIRASLDYFTERHCAPQWRLFVGELVAEFYQQIEPDLAAGFFRQIGERMARARPLGRPDTLEGLEEAVNAALGEIDWGWARLQAGESAIEIAHGAYPFVATREPAPEAWLVPVLEGLYTEWLNATGGNTGFRATCPAPPAGPDEPVRLRYGRPD
jgi:hypothetical protein